MHIQDHTRCFRLDVLAPVHHYSKHEEKRRTLIWKAKRGKALRNRFIVYSLLVIAFLVLLTAGAMLSYVLRNSHIGYRWGLVIGCLLIVLRDWFMEVWPIDPYDIRLKRNTCKKNRKY